MPFFSPSWVRSAEAQTPLVRRFFVIATFCFYKKKYCSSSLIFTSPLFRRRTCFFLSTNKYGKTFFAWDSTTMTVVWYAPPRDGMAIVFFVRATANKRSPFFPRGGRGSSPPPTRYSVFTFNATSFLFEEERPWPQKNLRGMWEVGLCMLVLQKRRSVTGNVHFKYG
jgi:hypothetical protein